MSITAVRKAELIKSYAQAEGDTGSPEVQVAILSERISNLTGHFKDHAKDLKGDNDLLTLTRVRGVSSVACECGPARAAP